MPSSDPYRLLWLVALLGAIIALVVLDAPEALIVPLLTLPSVLLRDRSTSRRRDE